MEYWSFGVLEFWIPITPSPLLDIMHLHTSSRIFTTEARRSQRLYSSFARSGDPSASAEASRCRAGTDRAKKAQPFGPFHTTLWLLTVNGQSLRSIDYLFSQRFLLIGRHLPPNEKYLFSVSSESLWLYHFNSIHRKP